LLTPFNQQRIDGAFVLLSGAAEVRRDHIARLRARGEPFVLFDEVVQDSALLSVRAAERDGGRQLTEHLIERGHRRIAFAGARVPWAVVEQRFLGFRDALAAARIGHSRELELFEAGGYEPSGGVEMARKLLALPAPPTAIICGSDLLALAVMWVIRNSGLRVPDDVAVAGFDDFAFSSLVEPSLTTVAVPAYEMGRTAATMLIDHLEGRDPPQRHAVFGVDLQIRAST